MIPKPLKEIEWSDIGALKDSGREEDDTIEFKGSFSGGSDFLEFNDKQQAQAVDGIAKEVIAFLNARGGDVVIGAAEFRNDHPKIEAITPLANVNATVDRLAQALAALIEPAQSMLSVRAITPSVEIAEGVIVIRAQSSLRAPHRSRRTKECYIRRGREAVPMPMDEVQDLSIRRADLRSEQQNILNQIIESISSEVCGRTSLPHNRFHVRLAFVPYQNQQIAIDENLCGALRGGDPFLILNGERTQISVPFRGLEYQFSPILRGRRSENRDVGLGPSGDFFFCSKDVRESGILTADFACCAKLDSGEDSKSGLYHAWIAGFAANALTSFQKVSEARPELREGFLGAAFCAQGHVISRIGQRMWLKDKIWPQGVASLPIFEIGSPEDFSRAINQIQTDAGSIVGIGEEFNWVLAE